MRESGANSLAFLVKLSRTNIVFVDVFSRNHGEINMLLGLKNASKKISGFA